MWIHPIHRDFFTAKRLFFRIYGYADLHVGVGVKSRERLGTLKLQGCLSFPRAAPY